LSVDARRLVAYLAVHHRPQARAALSADLWPGVAAAERLLTEAIAAVDVPGLLHEDDATGSLALAADVAVDLTDAMYLIRVLPTLPAGAPVDTTVLTADILPGWTAAWIEIERERFRQLRLRALEAACRRLTDEERLDEALEAGLLAVAAEPLRESAHRTLVHLHLSAGNAVEARRQYQLCRHLLRTQLGVEPSERMRELVRGLDVVGTIR